MVGRETKSDQLTIFVASGELAPDELLTAYADFIHTVPTRLVLWDLSSATMPGRHSEDMYALAKTVGRLASDRRRPGRSALVVGARDAEYKMARMLSIFLFFEKYPVEVEAFRDRTEARAWLLEAEGVASRTPSEGA
jgi:hypothetical protein